jgi:septal ring factor EnvC (AmiA/AmiB activator)
MDTYAECRKIVVPKERDLADAKAKLAIVEKTLNEKRTALEKVRRDVRLLEDNQKEMEKTLDKLVTTKEENKIKMDRATNLTKGLENESKRWAESIV